MNQAPASLGGVWLDAAWKRGSFCPAAESSHHNLKGTTILATGTHVFRVLRNVILLLRRSIPIRMALALKLHLVVMIPN